MLRSLVGSEMCIRDSGGTDGQGLNNGILYMLATPYLIVFGLGYFWWRNRKNEEELELEENIHLN